jgi:hypothetical protein
MLQTARTVGLAAQGPVAARREHEHVMPGGFLMTRQARHIGAVALALALGVGSGQAAAQESKSAPLVKELTALMDQRKLDAIAAKSPESPDQFVGALYFPGLQLLVVVARYSVPPLLNERILKKEYREVYIDLNSASIPDSKVFFEDLRADGLFPRRDGDNPFDIYEGGGRRVLFDGDWRKQKLSEQEYTEAFRNADQQYVKAIEALLAELKKAS